MTPEHERLSVVLSGVEGGLVPAAGSTSAAKVHWNAGSTSAAEVHWNAGASAIDLTVDDDIALAVYRETANVRTLVVAIKKDGTIKYGRGVKLPEASRTFYRVVSTMLRVTGTAR